LDGSFGGIDTMVVGHDKLEVNVPRLEDALITFVA
jgi:hypothetical protein